MVKMVIADMKDVSIAVVYDMRMINTFDLWLWHPDRNGTILVAFEIDWDIHPPDVQQAKWALTGQLFDRTHSSLSVRGNLYVTMFISEPRKFFGGKVEGHRMWLWGFPNWVSCG